MVKRNGDITLKGIHNLERFTLLKIIKIAINSYDNFFIK